MATPYPDKYSALNTGLLQGVQAGATVTQLKNQQDRNRIEDARYAERFAYEKEKADEDRSFKLIEYLGKLKTPQEKMAFLQIYAQKYPNDTWASQALAMLSKTSDMGSYKTVYDKLSAGDMVGAATVKESLGMPDDLYKQFIEKVNKDKEITGLRQAAFTQAGVSPEEQSKYTPNQLTITPTDKARADVLSLGGGFGTPSEANTYKSGLLGSGNPELLMGEDRRFQPYRATNTGLLANKYANQLELGGKPETMESNIGSYSSTDKPEDIKTREIIKGLNVKGLEERLKGGKEGKEVNLQPIVDTFLTRKFGSKYVMGTKEEKQSIINYLATPEGKAEFEVEAPKLATLMATPFYNIVPTSEGLSQFNARKPIDEQHPKPTGFNKPLSPEMIIAEQQIGTLKENLNRVKEIYNPKYVGFAEGRYGSLKENTIGVPEQQAAFYAELESVKNALIYLLSGKQINESEYKRLLKQLPERNLPDNVFEVRIKEFERTLNSIVEERHKASGGYGNFNQPPTTPNRRATDNAGTTTLTMPDGSIQTFDASGKRIK